MQISTREEDYIVDTMELSKRDQVKNSVVGEHLREIFADSKKLKVLHGADQDVKWLKYAFDIEVDNMFDTGQAARALKEKCSLKHLLKKYCSVKADKTIRLNDWT